MNNSRKWDQQKGFKLSCLALAVQMASGLAVAGPEGGTVTGGSGSISNAGNTTTITQQTDRMAIDWQSYDVAANERVQYIQPSSSSISLNRILSNRGSQIHGQIDANGQVFLINPHGIIFGEGASVNVGGLLASGLNIRTDDFINGEFALEGINGSEGTVVNHGLIDVALNDVMSPICAT
ncbi:filamentous hemagglutinin N-terminal domain-containing protein [Teredinibacter turnerae]|uniref:two-partner secretion domain-containing protein n=1 Tax=Teredinibacter turnerae TaxID=2426 RepID=UPI0005F820FB|nr:filamentous hemagglutinin N-terminal domain-containing protein [Teredinibacter turnerae]